MTFTEQQSHSLKEFIFKQTHIKLQENLDFILKQPEIRVRVWFVLVRELGLNYMKQGENYETRGDIPQAIKHFTSAYNSFGIVENSKMMGMTSMRLGKLFLKSGKNLIAKMHWYNAIKHFKDVNDRNSVVSFLFEAAIIYHNF